MKKSSDPATTPIVHKRRFGPFYAWTTDIDKFFGRNRHDNVLQACGKVRAADKKLFAENFFEGEYIATNGQKYRRYGVTRIGFVAMMKYVKNLADKAVLYLAAYDREEEEANRRKGPPDLDPAIIPDDPAALEPVEPTYALDLRKEPGGTEDHARRIIEVSGATETPELVAKIAHALPGPLIREDAIFGPVQPFVFDDPDGQATVRVIDRDGEAWFVALDLCRSLDITNVSMAVGRLDADEKADLIITDVAGRPQGALGVNEAGLYSLIMTSRKANAKRFKRWVMHEVLPQIRRTGRYEATPTHPALPSDYPSALRALAASEEAKSQQATMIAAQAQQVAALSSEKAELSAKLDEQAQFLEALRRLSATGGLTLVSDVAKVLHIPQGELFDLLYRAGYIFRRKKHDTKSGWLAYDKWVKKGLFDHRYWTQKLPDGTEKDRPQLFVTPKGAQTIWLLFAEYERNPDPNGQRKLALGMH